MPHLHFVPHHTSIFTKRTCNCSKGTFLQCASSWASIKAHLTITPGSINTMVSKGRGILLLLACAVLALSCSSGVQAADPACFLGSVCGNGCTSITGSCRGGTCVGLFGSEETCEPFTNTCGDAFCQDTEFCGADGTCHANNCKNQKQFGCTGDTSALNSVPCPAGSSFTACWASAGGGFKCNENANGPAELACSTASGSGVGGASSSSTSSATGSGSGVSTSAGGVAAASSSNGTGSGETGVVTTVGGSSPVTSTAADGRTSGTASVVGGQNGVSADGNVALGSGSPPPSQGAGAAAAVSMGVLAAAAAAAALMLA